MRQVETDRVPTGKHRPPIACRNTNWQLVLGQAKLPSYKSLRRFIRLEVALLSASVEGSAISRLVAFGSAGIPAQRAPARSLITLVARHGGAP